MTDPRCQNGCGRPVTAEGRHCVDCFFDVKVGAEAEEEQCIGCGERHGTFGCVDADEAEPEPPNQHWIAAIEARSEMERRRVADAEFQGLTPEDLKKLDEPVCPECGSEKLSMVTSRDVWLECTSCHASFVPTRERLLEACLLSHKDRTRS